MEGGGNALFFLSFSLLFLTTFLNLTLRCRHFFLIVIQVHPFKKEKVEKHWLPKSGF